jgi:tRNA (guanosine-2'-O-)-methyltransferase
VWYVPKVALNADQLIHRHGVERVTAALRPLLTEKRVERIEEVLDARLTSLAVVLENLHDPHNGAAAIRSLEGFGLACMHVVEGSEPFAYSSAVTIGAEKWISVQRHAGFADCAAGLRREGFRLLAMVPRHGHERARALDEVEVDRPLACVFGNERDGLGAETVAGCDLQVSLPMHGFTASFNLSVSVALVVGELARRRRRALGRQGDLSIEERALLRARWYVLSVRHAEEVLGRHVSDLTRQGVAEVPRNRDNG